MDSPREEVRTPWQRHLPWLLFVGLALALLPAVLRAGWALDDRELLFGNPVVDGSLPWHSAFARDYFHHLADSGQWRPLASLSLRVDRGLFGEWVQGYHLSNWAMHMGVVLLAWALLRELGLCTRELLLGLIVFALHPVLCDSVIWISGRTSMLSALFPLAGALVSERWRKAGLSPARCVVPGACGLLAGLLAKEDALIFAALLPLLAVRCSRAQGRACLWAMGAVLLLWCAGRSLALGAPLPSASSPALGSADLLARVKIGGASIIEALRIALLPFGYPPQYRPEFLLSRGAPIPPTAIAGFGWALLAVPTLLVLRRRNSKVSIPLVGLALASCAFLPLTQLVPLGEVFAPRFLYLPLLFAMPAIGRLGERCLPGSALTFVALGLGVVLSLVTYDRAAVYESRLAWRQELLRHIPGDAPSWNDLGLIQEELGDPDAARDAWATAIEHDPRYSRSWSNLGRVQLEGGEFDAAEASLREAVRVGSRNPIPRVNLASLLAKQGRQEEACRWYKAATQLSPGLSPAWRGLAQSLLELGRRSEALVAVNRALALDPGNSMSQALRRRIVEATN